MPLRTHVGLVQINPFDKDLLDDEIKKFKESLNVEALMSDDDREEKRRKLDNYFKINTRERENAIKWYKEYYRPLNQARLFLLAYKTSVFELNTKVSEDYKKWIIQYLFKLKDLREELIKYTTDYSNRKYRKYMIENKISDAILNHHAVIDNFLTITFHNTGVFKIESYGTDEFAESSFVSPV